MDFGLVGGVIGAGVGIVGGLIGGIVGTYYGLKNTHSQKERAFMARVAVGMWIGVLAFMGLFFMLPAPYNLLLWIPYAAFLPYTIITLNKRVHRMRQDEAQT